jgi:hypothetical protein
MQRQKLVPAMPRNAFDIEAQTGIAALSREADKAKLLQLLGTMAQFGPEAAGRINIGVLFDTLLRQSGIYEPGLVKTDEQLASEAQAALQQQLEAEAQKKLIAVGGNVMQNELSPTAGGPNAAGTSAG